LLSEPPFFHAVVINWKILTCGITRENNTCFATCGEAFIVATSATALRKIFSLYASIEKSSSTPVSVYPPGLASFVATAREQKVVGFANFQNSPRGWRLEGQRRGLSASDPEQSSGTVEAVNQSADGPFLQVS
jgi:hypothetical protein